MRRTRSRILATAWSVPVILTLLLPARAPAESESMLAPLLEGIPEAYIISGILHDRVLDLVGIERFDGTADAPAADLRAWRQLLHQLDRSASDPRAWPSPEEVIEGISNEPIHVIPLTVIDARYERLREDALDSGALAVDGRTLRLVSPDALASSRTLAFAALRPHTYRAGRLVFRLDRERYLDNTGSAPAEVAIDFDDGRGFVPVRLDEPVSIAYDTPGTRRLRLRVGGEAGAAREAAALFDARSLLAPPPTETLRVTGTIPYGGGFGSANAYVYLAEGHTDITNPVIILEGFDLDNSMGWDELYELLNREQLLETIRDRGFDPIVVDFDDATDYIQRHAFLTVELLQTVQDMIPSERSIPLAGASMGGLVGRYALAYMEENGIPHRVSTYLSFDSPQVGASIPLGLQYWLAFFADESDEAAAFLTALDSPAARQLLVYHHTDPPSSPPEPSALRTQFLNELSLLGDYPQQPRTVAVANGSGSAWDQGYIPGSQLIYWEYESFLVDVIGNVWSVSAGSGQVIFRGLIDVFLLGGPDQTVSVAGTQPYDSAPGGYRLSMADLDEAEAPYGDIVSLHDNHCFIPTVSALGIETVGLFYVLDADPDLLALTPFDAVYFPQPNEEHVEVTAQNVEWLLDELVGDMVAIEGDAPAEVATGGGVWLRSISPTGARSSVVRFGLPRSAPVRVSVHDARGRRVALIQDGPMDAGIHTLHWDGADASGRSVGAGVYFVQARGDGFAATERIVRR